MVASLVVALIILVAVLLWMFLARKKEARHLDDVHITRPSDDKQP